MEDHAPGDRIREAFSTFGQYLSDTVPPVEAVGPVLGLLNRQPALMSSEIIRWASAQLHGGKGDTSVIDYIFHAVNKLHYLAHLQLLSQETLTPYLDSVKLLLLDHFSDEERQLLQESFDSIGASEAELMSRVSVMHLQAKSCGGDAPSAGTAAEQARSRRHSLLWNRLKSEVRQMRMMSLERGGREAERDESVVPQLIAAAASDIQTGDEFRRFQENLSALRINPGTDHIFRTLGRSLPGWMIPTTGADAVQSHNPAIEAMAQIIQLAEDRWEACKRFQDMVQAAIEQFNAGSLARAATMFDLALSVGTRGKVDENTVETVRKTAHASLDFDRLREAVKNRDRHRLLRKVLDFFHEFAVENMLDNLRKEEKRDRRHLLLSLLEIYGDAARNSAFERLKSHLGDTNVATDWHFARNLVGILNTIPRNSDVPVNEEVNLISPLFRLSLPLPLIKEAVKHAGLNRCGESEELLIGTAEKLEAIVLEYVSSGKDPTQRISLLDRTISALAHFDTPKARATVIAHGVSRREEWGDTASRLAYLSGQDLTAEKESLSLLIQFLKNSMPRRLLGMTIQKNEQRAVHAVKALSSTPAPIVWQTFENIVARYPESKLGQAVAVALKEFNASEQAEISGEHMLSGDLDLFGLPDLLHQLNALRATGVLTLKDSRGQLAGIVSLAAGRMRNCSAGRLEGMDAVYQLLEVPTGGFFAFQGQKNSGTGQQPDNPQLPDLPSILSEGMRRYDELQRLRAIVPDFALLRRKGGDVSSRVESEDAGLVNEVWQKTAEGASPEQCEAACIADSYRIRSLLARWVETGVLTTE